METKSSSGEEEVVLTPASSHTSCKGGRKQSKDLDDFVSLMDENGIIGLLEALEIVGVGEYSDNGESCHKVPSGLSTPVEMETQSDEMGYKRSRSVSHRKSPADVQILTQSPVLNSKTETTGNKKNKVAMRRTDRKQNKSKHKNLSGMLTTTQSTGVAKERSQIFQHVSAATSTCAQPHLPDPREEIPAPLGIDAETFLDFSFTEDLEETHGHLSNLRLGPCFSPPAMFPEEAMTGVDSAPVIWESGSKFSDRNCQPPAPSSRMMKHDAARSSASFTTEAFENTSSGPDRQARNPTASIKPAILKKSSKSHLNGGTPDYSNVKPRVNFPKVLFKPPKSRLSSKRESPSTRPPVNPQWKSGKEVGLNIPGVPSATECQELGSPQEATRLLTELEENYNKLWIRYAEAENTIDQLRLAAKVNLYSDSPNPGQLVQSISKREGSKLMMLNFPQAQRAETSISSLHSNGHRTPEYTPRDFPDSPVTKEPVRILCSQANEFLQQMQTFEDLLNCRKLKPDEQRKELSQLFEGLRSLESSFLLAKDEHKLLKKEEENSHFDPDRELEGLIFDCVLYMDELKEHAEQITEDLLTFEPSPTPARSPSLSEAKEYLTHPQKTHIPSVVEPQQGAAIMFSSISNVSDREEAQKETANSLHLKTVDGKAGHNGEFNKPPDNHQNIREIPQSLALSQRNKAPLSTASTPDMHLAELEEEGSSQSIEKLKVKESPQRSRNLSPEDSSPHPYSSAQPVSQPSILDPSSRQGFEMRTSQSSSLSSLGEIAALEKKNSKLQSGSCRLPSQDGIFSPETDSGFNGTESRHPTPTGVPSLLHHGAMESSSAVQIRGSKTDSGVVTSPDPYSLLPSCCPATELSTTSKFNSKQPRRTKPRKGQRGKTLTCSRQCWLNKSESEMSDDSSSSVSEARRIGRYIESVTSVRSTSSRSSQRCHGSCTKVRSSTELTSNSVSMQTLQAEVSRLHKRLESCLKERGQSVSSSATMVQENHHHPRTSTPRVSRAVNTDERPCCGLSHNPDVLGCSDHPQTPPQSAVSRCTQTLSAASYTNTVHIKHRSVSVQAPEASDEPDTTSTWHRHPARYQAPCLDCISHQRAQAEVPVGSSKESVRSCCSHHCRHCGSTDTDCPRFTHSNTNTHHPPAEAVKCCASAAPPSPLQYLCPLPVLLCPSPSCPSPSNNNDIIAGVRRPKEARKFSASPDRQKFLDRSLNKAIRAAKHMKTTSGRMSHSLRFGLHQQQQLLTPLMSQLSQR